MGAAWLFRWVPIVLCIGVIAAPAFPSMAMQGNIQPEAQIAFDISSQPLDVALETYGITTGREVIYNGKLAVGRQSAAVRGVFAPEVALQILLQGTGLLPRYTAADAFVLVPSSNDPGSNPPINTAPPASAASRRRGAHSLCRTSGSMAFTGYGMKPKC